MIINRTALPPAAIKFFGLTVDPFDVNTIPGEEEIFTDTTLDTLAAQLRDAVLYKRFVAVTGAVGSGKTTLKMRVARELAALKDSSQQIEVKLLYPEFFDMRQISVSAIATGILEEFGVKVPRSSTSRVRAIKQHLTALHEQDIHVALVFDECHNLNEKVLLSLKNFWELTNGKYSRLLSIVLFGQPQFAHVTLNDFLFREIAERVQLFEIPQLNPCTAQSYLAHKLSNAGGDLARLFDPRAIHQISAQAQTPLTLGNLANQSLLQAYKLEEPQVAASMLNLPNLPATPKIRPIR